MKKKINLFIVGAMKAGTTSLTDMFEKHPQVHVCPIKEPHHFIKNTPSSIFSPPPFNINDYLSQQSLQKLHLRVVKDLKDYEELYREAPKSVKYLAEASTGYLHAKESAKLIYNYNPDAKIIILLRDGIKRAYSHYKMDASLGRTSTSFNQLITEDLKTKNKWGYISMSEYAEDIARYKDLFGANVLITSIKDVANNPKLISDFLSLSDFKSSLSHQNSSKEIKHKWFVKLLHDTGLIKLIRLVLPKKIRYTLLEKIQKDSNGIPLEQSILNELEQIFKLDKEKLNNYLKQFENDI